MNLHRRTLLKVFANSSMAIGSGAGFNAFAQSEPIKVYVGFPPGGLPDILARSMVQGFDGPAIVENRPGANGRLAAQAVKRAAPDGKSLLLVPASAMVHLPHIYKDLGYDPFTDFAPIAQIAENDFAFAINAGIPAQTLKEFAVWCKANSDKATFASPGQGSAPHFMGTILGKALGVAMLHVPYKGNSLALNDVNGGAVTSIFATSAALAPMAKNGNLRILGTTGRNRNAALPQVPTFKEQGIDSLTTVEGTWIFAPAKTPPDLVAKLSARVLNTLNSQGMRNALNGQATPAPLGPQELAKVMRVEYDTRAAAIRHSGFSADQ